MAKKSSKRTASAPRKRTPRSGTRSGEKAATPPHAHERGGVVGYTEHGAVGGRGIPSEDGRFTR